MASYINESYTPAVENDTISSDENTDIDANLEKFSATKTLEEEQLSAQEEVAVEQNQVSDDLNYEPEETTDFGIDQVDEENFDDEVVNNIQADFSKFEDFDMIEKSDVMSDVPQASALFNAIINKPMTEKEDIKSDINVAKELDDFMLDDKDIFTPQTSLNTIEEEPVLFPENDGLIFEEKKAKEEMIVEPEVTKPNFIDRVLGLSRARKNRKEQFVAQEPVTPKFTKEPEEISFSTEDELDNLDIPAFLRKK